MKHLVEEFLEKNECTMNTCCAQEMPDFFTTEDIKNKQPLCNEWVQRWRLTSAEDRINELRDENYKLQQETRELREAIKIIIKSFSI